MKKNRVLSILFIAALAVVSCGQKEKKEEVSKKNTLDKGFIVDTETSAINWIAYKTTDKVPVKGQFSAFSIDNPKKGATEKAALDGLKFSIPISSLQTNDTIRDEKLKKSFFGSMKNTSKITGTLHLTSDANGTADITMNGITQALPITYTISNQKVTIEAVLNLDNWKAQAAINALNLVCKDLHTGADGISKTWSDVKIDIVANLKKE